MSMVLSADSAMYALSASRRYVRPCCQRHVVGLPVQYAAHDLYGKATVFGSTVRAKLHAVAPQNHPAIAAPVAEHARRHARGAGSRSGSLAGL